VSCSYVTIYVELASAQWWRQPDRRLRGILAPKPSTARRTRKHELLSPPQNVEKKKLPQLLGLFRPNSKLSLKTQKKKKIMF
jgi:hypothetical protein